MDNSGSKMGELVQKMQQINFFMDFDKVREFLQIDIDEEGNVKPVDPDSDNYQLFKSLLPEDLQEEYMNNYYGKYPVIHMNFNCEHANIKSYEDALTFYKHVIHECFEKYKYLTKSEKLFEVERKFCERWCNNEGYKSFTDSEVCLSLKELSAFLCKHHGEKVFFIAQDINSPATEAVMNGIEDDDEAYRIFNLNIRLMKNIQKKYSDDDSHNFITELLITEILCEGAPVITPIINQEDDENPVRRLIHSESDDSFM